MNNACPTCGAVYAVATKDVGRKIKCKKCGSALRVDDSGLVVDAPVAGAAPPAVPAVPAGEFDPADDPGSLAKKKARRASGGGPGFGDFVANIGGVPAILFGFGIFFTLYFFFQNSLTNASLQRADGGVERVIMEREGKLRKLKYDEEKLRDDLEDKEITREKYDERMENIRKDKKKINKDYAPKIDEVSDIKAETSISTKRWAWFDGFGLLLGFILLAFGCVAYLRADTTMYMRIVAGVILCVMMMAIFGKFSGCQIR
jgi:predicted Zn finger-like uncharacterized protein